MLQPKVSIVIPVYNVSRYIEKCARSLFNQTLDDLEFIFIDDCSKDGSIDVVNTLLNEYPHRKSQTKIVRHQKNEGVGKTRQEGIDVASGEFIIHCDPDDWVEPNMYALMYDEARTNGCDIVICEYYEEQPDLSLHRPLVLEQDKKDLLNSIINGKFPSYLWNKLIRKDFAVESGLRIASDVSLWEDQMYVVPLIMSTAKVAMLHKPLYHYSRNVKTSITSNDDTLDKIISKIRATEYIRVAFNNNKFLSIYSSQIDLLMLKASHGLISMEKNFNPEIWREKNNVSTKVIRNAPIHFIRKIIYLLALKHQDTLLFALLKLLNK